MGDLIKAKLKAMGIHFGISVVVFLGVLYLILVQWYPGVLFEAEGGWKGLKLMAAVDLVLGPSLTFIIFNNKKSIKELTFDLSIVVMIQLSALIWGGMQVYKERPVAIVFWEQSFYTVTQDYFDKQDVSLEELKQFDSNAPLYIYAVHPQDILDLESMQKLNKKNIPPYAQKYLFRNYREHLQEIFSYEITTDMFSESITKKFQQLSELGKGRKIYVIPVTAKYKNAAVFMDETGQVLDTEVLRH